MKTILLCLMVSSLLLAQNSLRAQYEIKITGKNCKGAQLTANAKGGTITSLTWKLNDNTLPTDGSLRKGITVAGGNGKGNAPNQFNDPNGVFVDKKGILWVADTYNARIQKFTDSSGNGITVGGGLPNAPATPTNLYVDDKGAVYVADFLASRIKKLAKNGKEWVDVAGKNNEMKLTRGVWVDAAGNVYATDQDNNRVLKYAPNSNAGVVVAGGNGYGNALNQLAKPVSVVVDETNNIYVTEEGNRRVVKWLPGATQGIIVAGDYDILDSLLQKGDKGGIHDPLYGFVKTTKNVGAAKSSVKIYVSDIYLNEVQLWYEGDTSGVVVAGGHGKGDSANQLNKPFGNYVFGNYLFIADRDNARIQRFSLAINGTTPKIIAVKAGMYTAIATFSDGSKVVSNPIYVNENCSEPAGALHALDGKAITEKTITAFPNPATNTVTIQFFANKNGRYTLYLTEPGGKILLHKEVNAQAGANSTSFDVGRLARGTYVLKVIDTDKNQQAIHINKD